MTDFVTETKSSGSKVQRKRKRGGVSYQCIYYQHRSGDYGTRYNTKIHTKTYNLKPDGCNVDIDIGRGKVSEEVFLSLPQLKSKRICTQ